MYDADHTAADGNQSSDAIINQAGNVAGISQKSSGVGTGADAWYMATPQSAPQIIGLTQGEFARGSGYASNGNLKLSETGEVFGLWQSPERQVAWRFDPGSNVTTIVGLTDPAHTSPTGEHGSTFTTELHPAGHIVGISTRYDASGNPLGGDGWVYNATTHTTTPFALTDAEHTASDGSHNAYPMAVNASGEVAFLATRYSGIEFRGSTAAIYKPATNTYVRAPLTGALYTASDGTRSAGRSLSTTQGKSPETRPTTTAPAIGGRRHDCTTATTTSIASGSSGLPTPANRAGRSATSSRRRSRDWWSAGRIAT